ncbi:unnamed protein product [Mytilus edulis]|uniref:Mannosyltransferase n=1 Tax=Mytilus edulis TaxID=6550 RepID=A0A8S3TBB0_MYTED|nr:unnamed protein product [Mytilus edulis]
MKSRKIKEMKKMKFKHHTGNNRNGKCECGLESILPELLPWYLFVIVLCIRIHYVLQPKNWWLLHPDEIFQSVEVAFSEVYGNGFRTYEYSPSTINVTTPVEEQEMNQGMYSLRSFLYPQFFAVIFAVCKFVGIRLNCYLVGRICQCVVTSFTPVAVFRFCRTLFRCRGTASIAAMLTSFSLHISVLGTHTLVNSFISPFLFLSVDIILQYLLKPPAITDFSNDESLNNDSSSRYNHTENGSASIQCTMRDINSNLKIQKNPLNGAALQEQKNSTEDVIAHKELRFVHNVLIIIEILAAYAIHGALQFINSLLKFTKDKIRIVVMVFSLSVGLNTYMNFPSYGEETILPWKTVTPTDSSDINQCLFFISEQNNVTGVFIDNSIYTIAGFTILNHDVPLLTLIHHEYHEYRSGGYIPRTDLSYKTPRNLYVINRYSDIIDVTNIHYLSKRLLESQEYNYVVVPNKRVPSFSQLGFNKAPFSAGRYSVLQRLLTPIESTKLSIAGKNMPLGKNSTIMEYEASWLYTAGLYTKAIERLENAIELNNSRVRPFQLLASSYANKADLTKAKATEDKCILGHGRTACRKPQPRIVIHEDYKQYSVN